MNDPGPFFDDRIRCPSYDGGTETPGVHCALVDFQAWNSGQNSDED